VRSDAECRFAALSEAFWQRCHVHLLRNALDHPPRKGNDDRLLDLRWLYVRRSAEEALRKRGKADLQRAALAA